MYSCGECATTRWRIGAADARLRWRHAQSSHVPAILPPTQRGPARVRRGCHGRLGSDAGAAHDHSVDANERETESIRRCKRGRRFYSRRGLPFIGYFVAVAY